MPRARVDLFATMNERHSELWKESQVSFWATSLGEKKTEMFEKPGLMLCISLQRFAQHDSAVRWSEF